MEHFIHCTWTSNPNYQQNIAEETTEARSQRYHIQTRNHLNMPVHGQYLATINFIASTVMMLSDSGSVWQLPILSCLQFSLFFPLPVLINGNPAAQGQHILHLLTPRILFHHGNSPTFTPG
jgi:hypothetical protein